MNESKFRLYQYPSTNIYIINDRLFAPLSGYGSYITTIRRDSDIIYWMEKGLKFAYINDIYTKAIEGTIAKNTFYETEYAVRVAYNEILKKRIENNNACLIELEKRHYE